MSKISDFKPQRKNIENFIFEKSVLCQPSFPAVFGVTTVKFNVFSEKNTYLRLVRSLGCDSVVTLMPNEKKVKTLKKLRPGFHYDYSSAIIAFSKEFQKTLFTTSVLNNPVLALTDIDGSFLTMLGANDLRSLKKNIDKSVDKLINSNYGTSHIHAALWPGNTMCKQCGVNNEIIDTLRKSLPKKNVHILADCCPECSETNKKEPMFFSKKKTILDAYDDSYTFNVVFTCFS